MMEPLPLFLFFPPELKSNLAVIRHSVFENLPYNGRIRLFKYYSYREADRIGRYSIASIRL